MVENFGFIAIGVAGGLAWLVIGFALLRSDMPEEAAKTSARFRT